MPAIDVDAELDLNHASAELAESIERLAPFGRDNTQPMWLVRGAIVAQEPRVLGKDGRHLKVFIAQGERRLACMIWNQGPYADAFAVGRSLDAVIKLKVNRWQGRRTVEGEMVDFNLAKA